MTITRELVVSNQGELDDDMFGDLEPVSAFELKKAEVATHLAALMSYEGKTRSVLASELGWTKSRMTRVLSGKENLTIKTIWEFSSHLGLDFSVSFQELDQQKPRQPWQNRKPENASLLMMGLNTLIVPLEVQTAHEVALDLANGNAKECYISFVTGAAGESQSHMIYDASFPALTCTNLAKIDPATFDVKVTQNH